MNRVVYKYSLSSGSDLTRPALSRIKLPKGAKVLTAACQYTGDKIWCEVDKDEKELEERVFRRFETGELIDGDYIYITTLFENGYVYHLYELINESEEND